MRENLKKVKFNLKQKVMRKHNNPLSPDGGVVGLKGNLAPEGAIVKVAGLKKLQLQEKQDVLILRKLHLKLFKKNNTKMATS